MKSTAELLSLLQNAQNKITRDGTADISEDIPDLDLSAEMARATRWFCTFELAAQHCFVSHITIEELSDYW